MRLRDGNSFAFGKQGDYCCIVALPDGKSDTFPGNAPICIVAFPGRTSLFLEMLLFALSHFRTENRTPTFPGNAPIRRIAATSLAGGRSSRAAGRRGRRRKNRAH